MFAKNHCLRVVLDVESNGFNHTDGFNKSSKKNKKRLAQYDKKYWEIGILVITDTVSYAWANSNLFTDWKQEIFNFLRCIIVALNGR